MNHPNVIIVLGFILTTACSCIENRSGTARTFRVPDGFMEVRGAHFIVDLKYNTDKNFMGRNLYGDYGVSRCYVHRDLSARLERAADILARRGYRIVLWDCYRPMAVQIAMWKVMPDPRFVANPSEGSNHNRGIAVDCSIVDAGGRALPMPSEFDEFSDRASINYPCEKDDGYKCGNREILGKAMEAAGISRFPSEWWHFQLADTDRYPVIRD